MRVPSDAQGRFLAEVETFEPVEVADEVSRFEELPEGHRGGLTMTGKRAPLECGHRVRIETLTVCVREGWVSDHAFYVRHDIRAETGLTYWWERCRETLLTEDGVIALGLWRQKLARRPPEELSIEGADRDLIRAAAIAYEHGFALAPVSDEARGNARRLARGAFARRCFLGNSVRGLTVTAIGQVEAREGDEG